MGINLEREMENNVEYFDCSECDGYGEYLKYEHSLYPTICKQCNGTGKVDKNGNPSA